MGTEGVPLYIQIAESIRRQIASGQLKPGDRLPPVREMARRWGCTPGTVSRAYAELAREGLITGHRGGGTRVAPNLLQPQRPAWRWASLVNRAERFLLEAIGSGYTPEEAQAALRLAITRWETESGKWAATEGGETEAKARSPLAPCPPQHSLRFAGSHDLVVEQLSQMLRERPAGTILEIRYLGSLGGLIALARGEVHIAGTHLWDEATDSYNAPYVRRIFPGRRMALLTLAHRRLGLIVAPGNPLGIESLRDIARPGVRFINRQQGSGTRVWLDAQLKSLEVNPSDIEGYDREEVTHLDVAKAVAEGRADVGLGIEAAALAYGLGFVPLTLERYDIVIPQEVWDCPGCRALVETIRSAEFRAAVKALGGYETEETGRERWV